MNLHALSSTPIFEYRSHALVDAKSLLGFSLDQGRQCI
jgi:hypothetical protein